MNAQQIAQHRELYELLRARSTPPGYSAWIGGRLVRQSYVNKDEWTFDDALAAPDTEFSAQWQRAYGKTYLAVLRAA